MIIYSHHIDIYSESSHWTWWICGSFHQHGCPSQAPAPAGGPKKMWLSRVQNDRLMIHDNSWWSLIIQSLFWSYLCWNFFEIDVFLWLLTVPCQSCLGPTQGVHDALVAEAMFSWSLTTSRRHSQKLPLNESPLGVQFQDVPGIGGYITSVVGFISQLLGVRSVFFIPMQSIPGDGGTADSRYPSLAPEHESQHLPNEISQWCSYR